MKLALHFFAKSLCSLLGVGYLRPFPASCGSAVIGVALYFFWPGVNLEMKFAVIMVVFILGVFLADLVEGSEKIHDPSFIVIDEAVGMMMATILLQQIWWQWIAAFFLFRFFDILKPWPASWFDSRRGGFSLMMDDVVAASYSFAVLLLILTIRS